METASKPRYLLPKKEWSSNIQGDCFLSVDSLTGLPGLVITCSRCGRKEEFPRGAAILMFSNWAETHICKGDSR